MSTYALISKGRHTQVLGSEHAGPGGARHEYVVVPADADLDDEAGVPCFADISFQKGPVKENGVNGCHTEDLLGIVLDRLEGFQRGDFACTENELAVQYIRSAKACLNQRTAARIARGVEGTSEK